MSGRQVERRKTTILDLQEMKRQGRKITMLSISDYPMALLADRAGLDTILVGDSLAMTVLGYETTVSVTLEEMLHHSKAVTRATKYAHVVGDMPFMSNNTSERDAIINAGRFMQEAGTDSVKVEGGVDAAHVVRAIVRAGMPVMGHVGLTPQHISLLGGYKAQGRDVQTARQVIEDALAVEEAGAFAVILECVSDQIAKIVTERLEVPPSATAPASTATDRGLLRTTSWACSTGSPRNSSRKYASLSEKTLGTFEAYVGDVTRGEFPTDEHSYHVNQEILEHVSR